MRVPDLIRSSALSRREVLAVLGGVTAGLLAPACATSRAKLASPSDPSSSGEFLDAVKKGDAVTVERLLDRDVRLVRATDEVGRSAFVWAHLSRHAEIAAILQARGLELDVVEAVLAEDWDRVEALAKANPQLMKTAHPIGGTPLYASALSGGDEQYRLRSLGCESDARPAGGTGYTPARAAMDGRDPIGAWLAATDVLSNGGNVNAAQARGDSVLHGAVRARDARLVRLAVRKGGDVAARDETGRTPLELAEALEWAEGVELLRSEESIARDHRASRFAFNASREPFRLLPLDDVPQEVQSQVTGLSHFNPKRVRELLASDTRLVHSISTDAELAIEACGHTGQREVIEMHLDHGAPLSLPTAISLGNLEHARWLLDADPQLVHERGPHDFPVMWYPAIGKGSVEAAQLLLDHGAPLEQQSGGETALHCAALRGHLDLIRYLVERGANLDAVGYRQERSGNTPLQLAARKPHPKAVELLRQLGAS